MRCFFLHNFINFCPNYVTFAVADFKALYFKIIKHKAMERSYEVMGMTCTGCTQIVHDLLSKIPGVKNITMNLEKGRANVEMETLIPIDVFKEALATSLYEISTEIETDKSQPDFDDYKISPSERNKTLVSEYIIAAGKMDSRSLRACLSPEFEFDGPIHLHSVEDYIKMIEDHVQSGIGNILSGNEIKAIFTDDDEACVIYDVVTNTNVKRVAAFEKITIKENKILSTHVKFDQQRMKLLMREIVNNKNR
jgi:copper chaperone CopZ